ncbi:hypothetical protein ABIE45_001929 [Methylobacterium sp. OAE515]|jgi:hypothetical protein|uniref:hypothetical protein n=1 Tax=Methylobacterium sp. OAE515 TaxID=2817895 RepID=UPI00178978FA
MIRGAIPGGAGLNAASLLNPFPAQRPAAEATMTLALIIAGVLIVNFAMAGLFSLVALWAD